MIALKCVEDMMIAEAVKIVSVVDVGFQSVEIMMSVAKRNIVTMVDVFRETLSLQFVTYNTTNAQLAIIVISQQNVSRVNHV